MKKRELIHLHALLMRVAERFVERGVMDPEALADYEALGVTPMTLRASRSEHEEAVVRLARILGEQAATGERRPSGVPA